MKTSLLLKFGFFSNLFVIVLTAVFTVLKLIDGITWSWWWATSPAVAYVLVFLILMAIMRVKK